MARVSSGESKRITIRVSDEMYGAIEKQSERKDISKSEVVRKALKEYIDLERIEKSRLEFKRKEKTSWRLGNR